MFDPLPVNHVPFVPLLLRIILSYVKSVTAPKPWALNVTLSVDVPKLIPDEEIDHALLLLRSIVTEPSLNDGMISVKPLDAEWVTEIEPPAVKLPLVAMSTDLSFVPFNNGKPVA